MADIEITRANERRKAFANQFFNLGAALTGASAAKLYGETEFSWALAFWLIAAAMLISAGTLTLGLLEHEQ